MSLFDERGATLSPCGLYRYLLWRRWQDGPYRELGAILLNPSTADADTDDPTIVRLCRRARLLGYPGIRVVNLFAFRATDPRVMRAAPDPVGPENDNALLHTAAWCGDVLCAWGAGGSYLGRAEQVRGLLRRLCPGVTLYALRVGKDGNPGHPLYLPYSATMTRWE